jgi:hypothetical protein
MPARLAVTWRRIAVRAVSLEGGNPLKVERRPLIALVLCAALVFATSCKAPTVPIPKTTLAPAVFQPLNEALNYSYMRIFRESPEMEFSPEQIAKMQKYLETAQTYCTTQFKNKAEAYGDQLSKAQARLKQVSARLTSGERDSLHCQIANLRKMQSEARVLETHGIPIAYNNREAKLKLIQNWPTDVKQIRTELANGSYRNRRWGDVQDIGFRTIAKGQRDDIKLGQQAIQQMKQSGMMPKALADPAIVNYVNSVAQNVARHSDLHIPLHVSVLDSKEINAFALPGGYLFVERGLLESADDESELAGVIGHEIGHDVARHAHQLMEKATMAEIFYEAAEVAATMITGGVASLGAYYALQYGFEGVGMLLSLKLLGVSREFELQADQLGIQYAWNSGYDPQGFIRFFDKMSTKVGYAEGVSWFRDHPPFYTRMVDAEREIMFLPKKPEYIVQTQAFAALKRELNAYDQRMKTHNLNKPSLLTPAVPGCAPAPEIATLAGKQLETICALPPQSQPQPRQ